MRRPARFAFWLRWARRDARRHLWQLLSIAALLALGIGMYSAMSSMTIWRRASADRSFATLRMHDLRVSLAEGATARQGRLQDAVAASAAARQVGAAQERLVVSTQVDASHAGKAIIVPGRLVGADLRGRVDRVDLANGRLPPTGAVVLERNFARHYKLPPSGHITLAGGRAAAYTGQALAPEYFIVTAPGADFGAESAFAAVFSSLPTAQALSGQRGRVNEIVLRLRPGANAASVERALSRSLQRALPQTGFSFTARAQEPAHRLIYKDAEGDQQMLDIFAFLLLGAAAFAAFNLVSRTIEAQRREIGIGMALGVPPATLARRAFLLGGQIAVAGVAIGIPVGLAADAWLASVMRDFFPLPVISAGFQTHVYVRGAAIGLALPLLATALPVWRAVRVTPVEAIRVGARSARSSGLAWVLKGVRVPGGSLANLPVRNVLRTPRRTLMTLMGIGAVVTIVVALAGVMDSFDRTLAASRAEALAGSNARMTVDLSAPEPANGPTIRQITRAPSVGATQTSLRLPSTIARGGRHVDVALEVVGHDQRLWHPTLKTGSWPAGRPGVVLAQRAADQLRLHVGDRVAVRHPVPKPGGAVSLVQSSLPVAGIHRSPLRFVAYANTKAAADMHVAGLVNRVSLVPAAGANAERVKAELIRIPGAGAAQSASAMTDAVDQRMEQFREVLLVTVVIAGAMALLIAFNAASINADERTREHATMFAFGIPPSRALRGGVVEALIIGIAGTAVGLAGGHVLLSWMVNGTMATTMPDIAVLDSVSLATYVQALLAGVAVVAVAPLLTLRKLRRVDIPSALRVVE